MTKSMPDVCEIGSDWVIKLCLNRNMTNIFVQNSCMLNLRHALYAITLLYNSIVHIRVGALGIENIQVKRIWPSSLKYKS
jgi:hypothetical protein